MNIESPDLGERPCGFIIVSQELRHDSKVASSINFFLWTVEIMRAKTIGVEITAIFIAYAIMAIVPVSTEGTGAGVGTRDVAGVGSECCSGIVGFPEVHFVAACAVGAV